MDALLLLMLTVWYVNSSVCTIMYLLTIAVAALQILTMILFIDQSLLS